MSCGESLQPVRQVLLYIDYVLNPVLFIIIHLSIGFYVGLFVLSDVSVGYKSWIMDNDRKLLSVERMQKYGRQSKR